MRCIEILYNLKIEHNYLYLLKKILWMLQYIKIKIKHKNHLAIKIILKVIWSYVDIIIEQFLQYVNLVYYDTSSKIWNSNILKSKNEIDNKSCKIY